MLPSSMPKFEKPQKGNPHRLAVSQHVFPRKSIARFAGSDGRVHIDMRPDNLIRRAKPTDSIFCAQRAWDSGSEVGFIKKLEDDFQRLAESILESRVSSFGGEQTHIISCFYVLWMARAEIRDQPQQDAVLQGILPGREWSKDDEERLEKVGLAYLRGTTFPARMLNGLHVQTQVGRYLRQVNRTACWGVVRASGGEFVVPDWPVHAFIPINPILALANPAINQTLNRESVGAVNKQLKSASRRYFFARDFAACP
jgi:hypothetical protein